MAKSFNEIFESFTSVMELLRNEPFQKLLVDYERAKKVFLVGYDVIDNVSSISLFDAEDRSGLKPADYLIAFSEFIKRKEKEITAIGILLNKPKGWNTKALNELKQKLKESNYDEVDLQKAHKIVYHKEVVDIISMVKHAAKETEPLLSTEERVNQAIQKVTAGKELNSEQQKWMEYIKEHLKQNMTLDEDDLNELPVFRDRGGLNKFKKVFPGEYKRIINEINIAIAA
ncbi:MAG TPA: type I restriction-modification enzyme R subunit C-terminal domain-containing protein [Ignavibacteria bacterium]|nr:type I restriction-modification enzyme R subunit C-terminal domain-containing protein [Ignavibacteria bacterium]